MAWSGAAGAALSYQQAISVWRQDVVSTAYATYGNEFAQFSNYFHLLDPCDPLPGTPVFVLVIRRDVQNLYFGVIAQVLADTDSAKARCLQRTLTALQVRIPPSDVYVLAMKAQGGDRYDFLSP